MFCDVEDAGMNEYRRVVREWLDREDWSGWYAVTATLRDYDLNLLGEEEYVNERHAIRNVRHFLNRLNRFCFGKSAQRYGHKVEVIPCFEYGGSNNRLHLHFFIKKPNHIPEWKFLLKVSSCWTQTRWGALSMVIKKNTDSGWLEYITKDTRRSFENVDFENIWVTG